MGIALDDVSNVGMYQNRMPQLINASPRDVQVVAFPFGTTFDATGQIKITTWADFATPDQ